MRGRKPENTELVALSAGLAAAAGEDYIPPDIESLLEPKTPEDLLASADLGERLEDAVRIRNGWIYIMLRKKVGHGNFKNYLRENGRPYKRAWDCMIYARAVQRFPGLIGKIAGHAIRHVLLLDAPKIHQIEAEITGIPVDEAKKITRGWIEREYRKIQTEKAKPKKPPKNLPQDIVLPARVDSLVAEIEGLLEELAAIDLTKSLQEKLEEYRNSIEGKWTRAAYNLRDPKHSTPPPWELDPRHDDVSEG